MSSSELGDNRKLILSLGNGPGDVTILNPKYFQSQGQSEKEKILHERGFSYDFMFWSVSPSDPRYFGQSEIYESVGKPIIQNCLSGLNCSLFAYGMLSNSKIIFIYNRPNWFGKNIYYDGQHP
jgi:hypothetical protein